MSEKLSAIKVLGIDITNTSKENILKYILTSLDSKDSKYYIVTPNPEQIVRSHYDDDASALLNDARIALPDGVGVLWASRILGNTIKKRISGIEFMQELCEESVRKPATIGFLGGRCGVAAETAKRLAQKYPGLQISFVGEEWNEEGFDTARKYNVSSNKYKNEIPNTKYQILDTNSIDILFVAYGFPKQEDWMSKNIGKVPVKVMMAVGGSFDILSGKLLRAPQVLQSLGLEWLFRLMVEPWRWKRQLALLQFVWIVLVERLRAKKTTEL